MCTTAQKCVELMDFKRAQYSKAHYHVQFLMKEIAKRLGVSNKLAYFMTPKEIIKYLREKKRFKKQTLEKRYKR